MKITTVASNAITETETVLDEEKMRPSVLEGLTKASSTASLTGVVIGTLVGMTDEGRTPWILCAAQLGSTAVSARSIVDLQGQHIGKEVALMFEGADPAKPIIVGLLRDHNGWPLEQKT